jgi:nucleoside phosphorylase
MERMSTSKKDNLREAFFRDAVSKGSDDPDVFTLSAFCDWIRQQSIRLPSEEYLMETCDALLDLCVKIKISKTLINEPCRKMAGNLYMLSQELNDGIEEWKIAVSEKASKEKRERVRDIQDKLIDALKKFDGLCSWTEFKEWLPQPTHQVNGQDQLQIKDLRGKVDFAIITIRSDEFEAVLERFPGEYHILGRRYYSVGHIDAADERSYFVAVTRCTFQGTGEAQDVARDIIADLDPRWILVVGIAGGVPSNEFTLGDVVLSTKIYDMTVKAVSEGRPDEYAIGGGLGKKQVTNLVTFLPAKKQNLSGWNEPESIGREHPPVELQDGLVETYGDEQWQRKVLKSLKDHFGSLSSPRKPRFISGPILSSDVLVKDTQTIIAWLQMTRDALAVEMEAAGVYRAARSGDKEYPFLAIRGISDVIGLKRHQDWTAYACHSAAAFALAFVKGGFV